MQPTPPTANHVLVPSPLYLGQFISLTEHLVRETSSRTLVLCDEFGQRTARILAEEEVYTSKNTFRVCHRHDLLGRRRV